MTIFDRARQASTIVFALLLLTYAAGVTFIFEVIFVCVVDWVFGTDWGKLSVWWGLPLPLAIFLFGCWSAFCDDSPMDWD